MGLRRRGQVTKAVEPQKEERFFQDPAGNRTEEHRNPSRHNLLLRLDGLKLDYDGFGRISRRQDKNGVVQHFTYDDEQRVKEIRFEGNSEFRRVEYRYDPLGRRTHEVLWRYNDPQPETIRFDWQGYSWRVRRVTANRTTTSSTFTPGQLRRAAARAVQYQGQNRARTQRTAVAGAAESALPGPVPRPRKRPALQPVPLLRPGGRTLYADGPDRVSGRAEYLQLWG